MTLPRPPAELAWLTDLIGAEATFALVERASGKRVYVPGAPKPESTLAKLIGPAAAAALAEGFGREHIVVPLCKAWRARVYLAQGVSRSDIAHRLQVSRNTVRLFLHGRNDAAAEAPRARAQMEFPNL